MTHVSAPRVDQVTWAVVVLVCALAVALCLLVPSDSLVTDLVYGKF